MSGLVAFGWTVLLVAAAIGAGLVILKSFVDWIERGDV